MIRTPAILAIAAAFAVPAHAIVLCTTPDGKTYAGDFPPEGCQMKSKYERVERPPEEPAAAASAEEPKESAADAGAEIIRERWEKRKEAAKASADLARRRSVDAVYFVDAYDRVYGNGRFIEGEVANSADFPVYNVQVCINGNCRLVRPPTLQPGAQGSFSFRARPNWRASGNMDVTWDVAP